MKHQLEQRSKRAFFRAACAMSVLPLGIVTSGCASVSVGRPGTQSQALDLLRRAREAHGGATYDRINDINVAYDGQWYDVVTRLQPELTDVGFRKQSQERYLTRQATHAQWHEGPAGTKYVLRDERDLRVSRSTGQAVEGEDRRAAALVADAYRMFLLAPFELATQARDLSLGEPDVVDGQPCDVAIATVRGLGWDGGDKVQAFYDRATQRLLRLRFTIDALASTKGAVVEVDLMAHERMEGLVLPTKFFERVLRPVPRLPAHRWWLTGIDVNRGYGKEALTPPGFSGAARAPAKPWRSATTGASS